MVTKLSERIEQVLEAEDIDKRELLKRMDFDKKEAMDRLNSWINDESLPVTQNQVIKLSRVLNSSREELNLLITWQQLEERLEQMEQTPAKKNRKQAEIS